MEPIQPNGLTQSESFLTKLAQSLDTHNLSIEDFKSQPDSLHTILTSKIAGLIIPDFLPHGDYYITPETASKLTKDYL